MSCSFQRHFKKEIKYTKKIAKDLNQASIQQKFTYMTYTISKTGFKKVACATEEVAQGSATLAASSPFSCSKAPTETRWCPSTSFTELLSDQSCSTSGISTNTTSAYYKTTLNTKNLTSIKEVENNQPIFISSFINEMAGGN